MKNYCFIWFGLLLCLGLVSPLNAEIGPLLECQPASCFQYEEMRGLDTEWEGWKIHAGGQVAVDVVGYEKSNRKSSGPMWETLNLRLTGNSYENNFHFFLEPDLLGIDTKANLYEAWGAWDITPDWQLRTGLIKVALNTEFATRPENFPVLDYGFASFLDGRYDLGLQVDGLFLGKAAWCEGSVTAGSGFDLDGNRKSDPQYSIRAVAFPMQLLGQDNLKNGFIGLGLAYSPDYDTEIHLQTPLRSTVFTTRDLDGDSAQWLHAEVGWFDGSFRLGAERVQGEVRDVTARGADSEDFDQLTSWSVYGSWNITGEPVKWERGRWSPILRHGQAEPRVPVLGLFAGSDESGCWEIAGRYANADMDRKLFDTGLTTYNPSTQEVRTTTLNLNWYPQPGLKVTAGWVITKADQELGTFGDRDRDSSYLLRMNLLI